MKNWILLIVICILSISSVYANVLVRGYYINLDNDTVKVTYLISTSNDGFTPDVDLIQNKIKIYDTIDRNNILMPYMAKEISFVLNKITYQYYSVCIACNDQLNNLFLERIKSGKLNLYLRSKTYYSGSMPGMIDNATFYYVFQKDNQPLFEVYRMSFKSSMKLYFSDCPTILKKIKDDTYSYDDMEKIVDEYNATCN